MPGNQSLAWVIKPQWTDFVTDLPTRRTKKLACRLAYPRRKMNIYLLTDSHIQMAGMKIGKNELKWSGFKSIWQWLTMGAETKHRLRKMTLLSRPRKIMETNKDIDAEQFVIMQLISALTNLSRDSELSWSQFCNFGSFNICLQEIKQKNNQQPWEEKPIKVHPNNHGIGNF